MSLKRNYAYNSILTVSNYIFPFITFPYVSRVLGVTNIGTCNFVDSIINYFILLSVLGTSALGVREIAKNRSNPEELKKIFSSLFYLNAILTAVMLLLLLLSIVFVPKLQDNKELMLLGAVKLIFNLFLVEWFFQGMENFKYITIRSVIVKFLYVIFVFALVRDHSDYKIYYAVIVGTVVVNAMFNNTYRRRFVKFNLKNAVFTNYWKPFFTLGLYMVLTSMYTTFNVAYLGFIAGEKEVGFYTTATKLYGILLSLFTAFTVVMLPRMSSLVAENNFGEVKRLTQKSYDAILAFCLPIIILSSIFAPQIILIIAGPGYEGAILPMRIVMPLMLIIGIEQILVLQLLLPLKQDKVILINSIIGASIGILLNILLVKTYKSMGSSIVWICSEIGVLISSQYFVKRAIGIEFPYKKILLNICYIFPLIILCSILKWFLNLPDLISFLVAIGITGLYFFILQIFFIKNDIIISIVKKTPLGKIRYIK